MLLCNWQYVNFMYNELTVRYYQTLVRIKFENQLMMIILKRVVVIFDVWNISNVSFLKFVINIFTDIRCRFIIFFINDSIEFGRWDHIQFIIYALRALINYEIWGKATLFIFWRETAIKLHKPFPNEIFPRQFRIWNVTHTAELSNTYSRPHACVRFIFLLFLTSYVPRKCKVGYFAVINQA